MTVELVRNGNAIIALIGRNLAEGIAGSGRTVPEALRSLADAIEREKWPFPELDPPAPPSLILFRFSWLDFHFHVQLALIFPHKQLSVSRFIRRIGIAG